MLTFALGLALFQQDGRPPVTAAGLITKAFARYAGASSVVGDIRLTQTAQGHSVTVDSQLQYERPSRFFLLQRRNSSEPKQWLVTSDGFKFSYDVPEGLLGKSRYVENINVYFGGKPKTLTVGDVYLAANHSLGDRNSVLDIVVARSDDLKYRLSQWPTFSLGQHAHIRNVDAWQIVGEFREADNKPVTASFELYITDDGDIVRYVHREQMKFAQVSADVITVVSTWDVNLIVNGKTNPALFRVIQ